MSDSTWKDLGSGRSVFYGWGEAMHTRFDALLCHRPAAEGEAAFRRMLFELRRVEGLISRFDPASELSRVNAGAAEGPVTVGEELWEILRSALRYGARTDHAFDITHASTRGTPAGRVHLDALRRAVLFGRRGTVVDLGGYGKGYALARVQELLLEEGWSDFLLNFGNSSVCARGDRPGADGWTVGVENQARPGTNALEITLRDQSLNTSGNTLRHDGHIRSTGGAYLTGSGSVSVTTPGPLEGEVLSTALFAARGAARNSAPTDPGRPPDWLARFPDARAWAVDYAAGAATVRVVV